LGPITNNSVSWAIGEAVGMGSALSQAYYIWGVMIAAYLYAADSRTPPISWLIGGRDMVLRQEECGSPRVVSVLISRVWLVSPPNSRIYCSSKPPTASDFHVPIISYRAAAHRDLFDNGKSSSTTQQKGPTDNG
jgi:hypothetical protein